DGRGDDGRPARQRLEHGGRERVGASGVDAEVGGAQDGGEAARRDVAEEAQPAAAGVRVAALAADDEPDRAAAGDGLDEQAEIAPRARAGGATGEDDD